MFTKETNELNGICTPLCNANEYYKSIHWEASVSWTYKYILYFQPEGQWWIAGGSLLRIIGVPLLMLCNAQPRKHLPVLFLWDWEYIIIMIVFSFTNGYCTNIIMVNSTR